MASSKLSWGFILGSLGLAVALFAPYKKDPEKTVSVPVRSKKTAAAVPSPVSESRRPEETVHAANLQQQRERHNTLLLTGVKEIQSQATERGLQIKLRTKAEARSCQTGDFDIIKSLVRDGQEKVFLLSIEKLDDGSDPHPSMRLNLMDIMKGERLDFVLPKQANAQEYGVFLCLDPDKSNSCGRKAALAPKDWNAALNKSRLPNNILYYQLITTQDSKAYVIPVRRWGRDDLQILKGRLGRLLSEPDESLKATARLMSKLGSLPATVDSGSLDLPLPYRDPRCENKASLTPSLKRGGG